jgi:uncharacterized surface protein with fasciclin (FAS1) repeats
MMMTFRKILFLISFSPILLGCLDTVKENNKEASLEDQTPVLKEEWKGNMNDWSDNDYRSTMLATKSNNGDFDSFVKLLKASNLYMELEKAAQATLFIPTNAAIQKIGDSRLAELKSEPENKQLSNILKYHFVPNDEFDLEALKSTIRLNEGIFRLKTLQGGYLALTLIDGDLFITDEMGTASKINANEIQTSNGIIYSIENILMPQ